MIDQIKAALEQIAHRRMENGFREVLRAAVDEARRLAPVRTGRLRTAIRSHMEGRFRGRVTATVPYAKYLIAGTGVFGPKGRPITIGPKKKKTLFWPGAAHPVRMSVIKGIRPNDFLGEALRRVDIAAAFSQGVDEE